MRVSALNSNAAKGFSLVELMISMAIGIFLIMVLVAYAGSSAFSYRAATDISQLQNNGRSALDLIVRSIKKAGYYGLFVRTPEQGTLAIGVPVVADLRCRANSNEWPIQLGYPLYGENNRWNNHSCAQENVAVDTSDEVPFSDIITVRYASAESVNEAELDPDLFYLRSSLRAGAVFLGNAVNDNQLITPPYTTHKLIAESFFIAIGSQVCRGKPIPSLYKVDINDSGRPFVLEMIPGIERLEMQYLFNGEYLNANEISDEDWHKVSAVKIWLLARSFCDSSGTEFGERNYSMGDQVHRYPNHDTHERLLLSSTVAMRNLVLVEVK